LFKQCLPQGTLRLSSTREYADYKIIHGFLFFTGG